MRILAIIINILALSAVAIIGGGTLLQFFPPECSDDYYYVLVLLVFLISPALSSAVILKAYGIRKKWITIIFLIEVALVSATVSAIAVKTVPKPYQETETVEEVYIPLKLDECFAELDKILSPEAIQEIMDCSEDDLSRFHFGLGMGLRNSWGLWEGSDLAKWFNEQGIFHPDDMSGIIINSYWRHLNDYPLMLKEQILDYQKFWEDQKKKEANQGMDLTR